MEGRSENRSGWRGKGSRDIELGRREKGTRKVRNKLEGGVRLGMRKEGVEWWGKDRRE